MPNPSINGQAIPIPQKRLKYDISATGLDTLEITSENVFDDLDFTQSGKNDQGTLVRRARSKYLNSALSGRLIYLNSPLRDKYRDTYYCSHTIRVNDDNAQSMFCKNRWCIICNRIRTAQLIQTYLPTLDTWTQKQFVTLTVPNCQAQGLSQKMGDMLKAFTKIKDRERKEKRKIIGIRKLEITYNRAKDDYHPHYHFILKDADSCHEIVKQWLKHFPDATNAAQDWKPADKNSCFELFKYFTKLTSNSSKDKSINVSALDTIFQSIQGVRTFQPFGFIAHKCQPPPENVEMQKQIYETSIYTWEKSLSDFLDKDSGEFLTNYKPSKHDVNFTKNIR